MNILIVGNLGYVGFVLSKFLKENLVDCKLTGFDANFFNHSNDKNIDHQLFGDVRSFDEEILNSIDVVVYLAAISNDPMGNKFEIPTLSINCNSAYKLALYSKNKNVRHFIFASSCSVYGLDDGNLKSETSEVNPLTTYAKSKIEAEKLLYKLHDINFLITNLRFATATGYSTNMRLDLVLNDFVASAITDNKIEILSNGKPFRPLIHLQDMSRAIYWSSKRNINQGGSYLIMNVGSNEMNFRVIDLANNIKKKIPNLNIEVNHKANDDKRSYQVDFSMYKNLAKNYLPKFDLDKIIDDLIYNLTKMRNLHKFRESSYIRLNVLNKLISLKKLSNNLEWMN